MHIYSMLVCVLLLAIYTVVTSSVMDIHYGTIPIDVYTLYSHAVVATTSVLAFIVDAQGDR